MAEKAFQLFAGTCHQLGNRLAALVFGYGDVIIDVYLTIFVEMDVLSDRLVHDTTLN